MTQKGLSLSRGGTRETSPEHCLRDSPIVRRGILPRRFSARNREEKSRGCAPNDPWLRHVASRRAERSGARRTHARLACSARETPICGRTYLFTAPPQLKPFLRERVASVSRMRHARVMPPPSPPFEDGQRRDGHAAAFLSLLSTVVAFHLATRSSRDARGIFFAA